MRLIHLFVSSFLLFSCIPDKNTEKKQEHLSSDRYQPVQKWILPSVLDEISGLTYYNNNQIAGVNDEQGLIFIYDLDSSKVTKTIKFNKGGDYEGIAYSAPIFHIIRSDGKLFEYNEKTKKLKSSDLPFTKKNDIEGLCYENDSTLLLCLKGNGGKNGEKKKYQGVYRYNINTKKTTIAYKFKSDKKVGFSGISVNTKSKQVFMLSHKTTQLFIFPISSEVIVNPIDLDVSIFHQPEGICFDKEGNLYISNEQRDLKNANILKL